MSLELRATGQLGKSMYWEMYSHIVSPFMGFVDNKTNTQQHQTYPVKCILRLLLCVVAFLLFSPLPVRPSKPFQSVMSSSRSLSGEPRCLYSVVLDMCFQLVSFWLPILCERPRWARRLADFLSSVSSAVLPWARSPLEWWKSWRKFSRFRAQGPSFCQLTLWKAMMQCRFPPTCEPGNVLLVQLWLKNVL